jgi:glycosyltransferase involved in cell wall biosynthesis
MAATATKPTISVLVPALNEEKNIEAAIRKALRLVAGGFSAYEIIAINDGSTDGTGQIMEQLAKENKSIKVTHHDKPWGLGGTYRDGLSKAKYEYFTLVAGDNEELEDAQQELYKHVGEADMIVSYTINSNVRGIDRQILSNSFTLGMNLLFWLNMKYYTGANILRTDLIRSTPMYTDGFAYMPSLLTRLVKRGYSYKEVPNRIQPSGKTSIYKWKNVWSVIREIIRLFIEVNIADRGKYSKKPNPVY